MDKDDDQVLQEAFPEEAVPLVLFNEEKKSKFNSWLIFCFSIRTQRRGSTVPFRAEGPNRNYCGSRHVSYRKELPAQ